MVDQLFFFRRRHLFEGEFPPAGKRAGWLRFDEDQPHGLPGPGIPCPAPAGIMFGQPSCRVGGHPGIDRSVAATDHIGEPGFGHCIVVRDTVAADADPDGRETWFRAFIVAMKLFTLAVGLSILSAGRNCQGDEGRALHNCRTDGMEHDVFMHPLRFLPGAPACRTRPWAQMYRFEISVMGMTTGPAT